MTINPLTTKYKVMVPISGGTLDITSALTELTPEEQPAELAQRLNLTVVNATYGSGMLSDVLTPGRAIYYYSDWGQGMQEVFRGVIWDWDSENSSTSKTLVLGTYDLLIYLEKSKDYRYYSAGMSTKATIADIAKAWGIPLSYAYGSITHAKQVFKSQAISDMITTTLDDAKSKLGYGYVVRAAGGVMQVLPKGSNSNIYLFDGSNSEVTSNKLSMDDLITKVIVLSTEDSNERASIQATVYGQTQYGTLQDIVQRDSDTTLGAAVTEAKQMIADHGKLSEDRSIDTIDVPCIRKGDKVYIRAGTLNGYFYVTGVTHNVIERKMTMQIESV